jgi:hypothetical protein
MKKARNAYIPIFLFFLLLSVFPIVFADSEGTAQVQEVTVPTGPGPKVPTFDLTIIKFPQYVVTLPFFERRFQFDYTIHNKGDFGAEITITYYLINQNGEVIYEASDTIFLNAKESRQISSSVPVVKQEGIYTVKIEVTEPATLESYTERQFQVYSLWSWLIGPGLIILFIIIVAIVAFIIWYGGKSEWFDFL